VQLQHGFARDAARRGEEEHQGVGVEDGVVVRVVECADAGVAGLWERLVRAQRMVYLYFAG